MKTIIGILTLTIVLSPFLCGCNKTSKAVYGYAPEVEFRFVDGKGNILRFEKDGKISSHDFVKLNSAPIIDNDKNFLEKNPIEVLSVTEGGKPTKYRLDYKAGCIFQFTFSDRPVRKREYVYVVRYKVPQLKGETVEELRFAIKDTELGVPDGWHNCQHNGKNIHIYKFMELFTNYYDPSWITTGPDNDRMRRMFYNGNLVAVEASGRLSLLLPTDFVGAKH